MAVEDLANSITRSMQWSAFQETLDRYALLEFRGKDGLGVTGDTIREAVADGRLDGKSNVAIFPDKALSDIRQKVASGDEGDGFIGAMDEAIRPIADYGDLSGEFLTALGFVVPKDVGDRELLYYGTGVRSRLHRLRIALKSYGLRGSVKG